MGIELAIVLTIVAIATGSTIGIGLSMARARTPAVRVTTVKPSGLPVNTGGPHKCLPEEHKRSLKADSSRSKRYRVISNPEQARAPGHMVKLLVPGDEIIVSHVEEGYAYYDLRLRHNHARIKIDCLQQIEMPNISNGTRCRVLSNEFNAYKGGNTILKRGDTITVKRIEGPWAYFEVDNAEGMENYIALTALEPVKEPIKGEPIEVGEWCKLLNDCAFHKKGTLVKVVRIKDSWVKDVANFTFNLNDLRPIRKGDKMRILRNNVGARINDRLAVAGDEIVVDHCKNGYPIVYYHIGGGSGSPRNQIYMNDIEHV